MVPEAKTEDDNRIRRVLKESRSEFFCFPAGIKPAVKECAVQRGRLLAVFCRVNLNRLIVFRPFDFRDQTLENLSAMAHGWINPN